MLILNRSLSEQVVIEAAGKRIVVTVVETRSGRAKLGFEAPSDVIIHRKEIADAIEREGRRKPPLGGS